MELNREQAIEILDKFEFFQGQRAGRELWSSKPFEVQNQDIVKFSQDVNLLKNYIKKLTEENERLKAILDEAEKMVKDLAIKTPIAFDNEINKAKADTAREIFDLVECAFSPVLVYEGQTIKRYIAELEQKYAAGGAKMDGERSENGSGKD